MAHNLLVSLVLCASVLLSLQDCKDPITNECGCILRRTFTSEWLQLNYPDVAAEWAHNITAPTASYPKCGDEGDIVFTCPDGQKILVFNFANNSMYPDSTYFPNPTVISYVTCDQTERRWIKMGLVLTIDDTFNSTSLGCSL